MPTNRKVTKATKATKRVPTKCVRGKASEPVVNLRKKIKSEVKTDEQTKNAASVKTEEKPTKIESAAQMPPNIQVDSKVLVVSAPRSLTKKSRPSLSIPEPNAANILDTRSRLHIVYISASGYGVAVAT